MTQVYMLNIINCRSKGVTVCSGQFPPNRWSISKHPSPKRWSVPKQSTHFLPRGGQFPSKTGYSSSDAQLTVSSIWVSVTDFVFISTVQLSQTSQLCLTHNIADQTGSDCQFPWWDQFNKQYSVCMFIQYNDKPQKLSKTVWWHLNFRFSLSLTLLTQWKV